MFRSALDFLYGSVAAAFNSNFSLDESIRRLKMATRRTSFSALTSQQAVGRVSAEQVVLQRAIPFVGNSFKPCFVGRFEPTRDGIVLTRRFSMHWSIKAFLTCWFGFCLLWTVMALHAVLSSQTAEQWWFPLAGVGMIGFGVGILQLGKFFARNDMDWISNVIRRALSPQVRPDSSFRPNPLRGSA